MTHEVRVYTDPNEDLKDNLLPEYHFNYSKAKPISYANRTLRALVDAVPPRAGQDIA